MNVKRYKQLKLTKVIRIKFEWLTYFLYTYLKYDVINFKRKYHPNWLSGINLKFVLYFSKIWIKDKTSNTKSLIF